MASRTRRHHREGMHSPETRRKGPREDTSFNSSYRDSSATYDSDSDAGKENPSFDEADSANMTYDVDVLTNRSPVWKRRTDIGQSPPTRLGSKTSPRNPKNLSPGNKYSPTQRSPTPHDSSGEFRSPDRSFGSRRSMLSDNNRSSLSNESFRSSRTSTPVRRRKPVGDNGEDMMKYVIALAASIFIVYMGWGLSSILWPSGTKESVGTQTPILKNEVVLKNFESKFAQVKERFPGQSKRFWATLAAATKRVIKDENPIQPAVIIIAAPQGTMAIANCILNHFVTAVTDAHESRPALEINITSKYSDWKPFEAKLDLDQTLSRSLQSGTKAVGFYHLENLDPLCALLLHGYCDNENAPFKDVALVFSVYMNDVASSASAVGDALLEEFLYRLWGTEIEIDNLSALLSRVANNVALVKPEDVETLNKNC